jgi:DNA-binding CsgD family transcriptional regulator
MDCLTPQELQIVRLAASGFSNREIGRRLYLSHRTVESHLYRVFPKLRISSRAQLSAALSDKSGPQAAALSHATDADACGKSNRQRHHGRGAPSATVTTSI